LDAAPLSLFVTEALLKLQIPVVVLPKSIFTQLAHSLSNLSAARDSSLCLNEMTTADLTYKLSAVVEFSLLTSSQYPFEIVNRITPKSYHFRPFSRPPKR
jgi:hypothetical protein